MPIADRAPSGDDLTDYDREHCKLYIRLLDADAAGASWEEATSRLLGVEPARDLGRARLRYETHLARAKWMRDGGYSHLLKA